jgi:hypothetical protein
MKCEEGTNGKMQMRNQEQTGGRISAISECDEPWQKVEEIRS